ncbi:hypothetical protein HDU78_005210 [Chytriomyces hyalinus]|nr:hypothetical protein HDU78_005210 [Chytriomyces hyalinus]
MDQHQQQTRVLIVGAGTGGTAMAARLARRGMAVTVVEKNDFVGGRCSLIEKDGFRFDQGPSMLMMPHAFEQTFADLGCQMSKVLDVRKCKTNYKIHFPDGDNITLSTDMTAMKDQLERIEPGSFDGYLGFLREAKYHHDKSFSMVLNRNYKHWWDLVTIENAVEACKLHILSTVWNRTKTFFKSDKLRKAFSFQSMYMGMSPYDAPGAYTLLDYSEATDGILYPMGGFNTVIKAMESIAKSNGATFRYSCPVKSIIVDKTSNLATGVLLENGEELTADIVVCNMDLVTAYSRLLPPTKITRSILKKNQSCSTISFYWGLDRKLPEDAFHGHNIFLAQDYKPSFDAIFKDHSLPESPSFYVQIPTRVDAAAAPEGKESVTILVPIGILTDAMTPQRMQALVSRARAVVIENMQKRIPGCTDFEKWIESETVNTPFDWEEKFNLWNGSALGLSHEIMQVLYFRPQMRHEVFGNVFFVGASTHPGTGVPVVLCGARILEDEIAGVLAEGNGFKHQKLFGVFGYELAMSMTVFLALISAFVLAVAVDMGLGKQVVIKAL